MAGISNNSIPGQVAVDVSDIIVPLKVNSVPGQVGISGSGSIGDLYHPGQVQVISPPADLEAAISAGSTLAGIVLRGGKFLQSALGGSSNLTGNLLDGAPLLGASPSGSAVIAATLTGGALDLQIDIACAAALGANFSTSSILQSDVLGSAVLTGLLDGEIVGLNSLSHPGQVGLLYQPSDPGGITAYSYPGQVEVDGTISNWAVAPLMIRDATTGGFVEAQLYKKTFGSFIPMTFYSFTGDVTQPVDTDLSSLIAGFASVGASLVKNSFLDCAITGTSTASASFIGGSAVLSSSIYGRGTTTASLERNPQLSLAINGTTTITAIFAGTAATLGTSITGTSSVSASLESLSVGLYDEETGGVLFDEESGSILVE